MNMRLIRSLIDGCSGIDELKLVKWYDDSETTDPRFAFACLLMACESHERYADTGPVQVGIVGGEIMEFGKQRGVTQIPF